MKKLLSIAAVAALLSTGAMAVDTITLQGEVQKAATVQLKTAVAAGDLTSNTGVFNDYAMSARKILPLDTETTMVEENLYLQTNGAANTVTMAMAYTTLSDGTNTLPLKAYYDKGTTGTYALQATTTTFSMTDAITTDDGSTVMGKLKITGTPVAEQVAGNYDGTIAVTITPN